LHWQEKKVLWQKDSKQFSFSIRKDAVSDRRRSRGALLTYLELDTDDIHTRKEDTSLLIHVAIARAD